MSNKYFEHGIIVNDSLLYKEKILLKCPKCCNNRKKKRLKTLTLFSKSQSWHCHHCGYHGKLNKTKIMEYKKPERKNFSLITETSLQYLSKRGISQQTIIRNKIVNFNKPNWISFPYFRDSELVNYKARSIIEKDFLTQTDGEHIIYKYNDVVDNPIVILTEGEIDSLSFEEAGYINACSLFAGSPNVGTNAGAKLNCIDNCYHIFDNAKSIILALDNDENGRYFKKILIAKFGAEKCLEVDFKDCKDANEYLIKYSKEELSLVIKNAKHVKIDGIYIASEFTESLLWTKRNGKIRGTTTHIASLDKGWTWRKQENNLWSGYANEGKSQFLYYLSILKAKFDNWKFAIFSPENMPIEDLFDDLIQMFVNKTCDAHYANVMSDEEYIEAINFISNHFFIIAPPNDSKLDSIFSLLNFVVSKNSIDAVIIDPYNQIEHIIGKGERDDLYVGRFMSSLKKFAVDKNISMNLVAHQNTPDIAGEKEYPKPNMYRVKGGGTFADKVDNLILVWRPYKRTNFKDPTVMILVQKIKKQRLVGIPQEITLHYIIDKYMYVDPNNYDFKMNMLKQANNTNDENNVFDTSYNVNDITMTF